MSHDRLWSVLRGFCRSLQQHRCRRAFLRHFCHFQRGVAGRVDGLPVGAAQEEEADELLVSPQRGLVQRCAARSGFHGIDLRAMREQQVGQGMLPRVAAICSSGWGCLRSCRFASSGSTASSERTRDKSPASAAS